VSGTGKAVLSSNVAHKSDRDENHIFPQHVFLFIFQRNEDELILRREKKRQMKEDSTIMASP